jgi:hypothetical protein
MEMKTTNSPLSYSVGSFLFVMVLIPVTLDYGFTDSIVKPFIIAGYSIPAVLCFPFRSQFKWHHHFFVAFGPLLLMVIAWVFVLPNASQSAKRSLIPREVYPTISKDPFQKK